MRRNKALSIFNFEQYFTSCLKQGFLLRDRLVNSFAYKMQSDPLMIVE